MEESLETSFCVHSAMDCLHREVKFASPSLFSNTRYLNKTMQKKLSLHQLKRDRVRCNPMTNGVLVVVAAATETWTLISTSLNHLIAVRRDGRGTRVLPNFQNLMENKSLSKSLQSKITRNTLSGRSLVKSHWRSRTNASNRCFPSTLVTVTSHMRLSKTNQSTLPCKNSNSQQNHRERHPNGTYCIL